MNKVSWFVKVSAVTALAAVVALFSVAGSSASNASAATPAATAKAEELKVDTLCKAPPTPTPVPTTPAPAETKAAAPAATTAPTKAAAVPTAAATKAAPTAKPPTATKAPPTPTATAIPKGKVPAWMGVTVTLNKKMLRGGEACVSVLSVNAGGPAAVAGLKAGDLILGIDKVVVKGLPDVYNAVEDKKSADVVEVTYQREGKAAKAKVTLGLNPNAIEAPAAATPAATASK